MRKSIRGTYILQGGLALLAVLAPRTAAAAPQTLDCVLTDIETKSGDTKFDSEEDAEKRAIAVIFDDGEKTLAIQADGKRAALGNVAISQTSMTASAGNISLGIDRSSWRIVFQTYGQSTTRNEFGDCSFRH